jgi:hypothetical protein
MTPRGFAFFSSRRKRLPRQTTAAGSTEKSLVPLTDQMAARIALVEGAIGKTQTDKRTAKAAVIDFFHPGTGRALRGALSAGQPTAGQQPDRSDASCCELPGSLFTSSLLDTVMR